MNALAESLKARIAAEGPIEVDDYMAAANAYYYATRDPFGRAGDFVTAPEVSQMFGEMIGAALADAWQRAGSPLDAIYAELGPGRGTLACDALGVLRKAGFAGKIHLIETSPVLRSAQAAVLPDATFHEAIDTLPSRPILLVANEFFDALPVKQWVGDEERRVTFDGRRLAFTSEGPTHETAPERDRAVAALARHLAAYGGVALIIDYGYAGGETGDTLQAVRGHCFADPLDSPGEQDISAHVDFMAFATAASGVVVSRILTQGSWLETLGIAARATKLAASNPEQTEAIAAARRRLCDDQEMGRMFKVVALRHPDWPDIAGLQR